MNTWIMRKLNDEEHKQLLKILVFTGIISADNDEYTEEVKQEVIRRYYEQKGNQPLDWSVILDPLGEDKYKYMKILAS